MIVNYISSDDLKYLESGTEWINSFRPETRRSQHLASAIATGVPTQMFIWIFFYPEKSQHKH